MDVPPPEIREDTGEIEAALDGAIPDLVAAHDIRGDLHAHTTSTDAHATLEENREMAASLGYEYIAVTDHAYDLRMVGGLDVEHLEEQWDLVDALNADGTGVRILKGIELNIGEGGRVDYDEEVLRRFDLCIASLHGGWNESPEDVTKRLLGAMQSPYVDIIGHPTGRIIGRRDPLALDMDAVFEAAATTGTALELNAYPDRLDLKAEHVRRARETGVRLAISTDAHRVEHMRHMRFGILTARRGWATATDVLNTLPADELLASLKRNR
jgi:DNA polymerase (family 10)